MKVLEDLTKVLKEAEEKHLIMYMEEMCILFKF